MPRSKGSGTYKLECTTIDGVFTVVQAAELAGVGYRTMLDAMKAAMCRMFRVRNLRFRQVDPDRYEVPDPPIGDPLIEALRQGQNDLWTHDDERHVRRWALTARKDDLDLVMSGKATLTVDYRGAVIVGYPAQKHRGIFECAYA